MQRTFRLVALATVSLLTPALVLAHDASKHKGKATTGEITTVSNDRFEMKTTTGNVTVAFSTKTKFEHGNQVVDKTHLKQGEKVSVIGTKLPNGELVAREVLLGTSAPVDHSAMKHDDKAAGKKAKPADQHKQH